jgi:hypothetical protein
MSSDNDLWPSDLVANIPRIPMTILQEQANALGRHTQNVVQAKVKSRTDEAGDFVLDFVLFAPSIKGYQYTLFSVWHDEGLYPVRSENDELNDEPTFRTWLKRLFAEERTLRIVRALVAQAKADDDIPF